MYYFRLDVFILIENILTVYFLKKIIILKKIQTWEIPTFIKKKPEVISGFLFFFAEAALLQTVFDLGKYQHSLGAKFL